MRVAVLWATLSGYLNACLRELASRSGVELLVAHEATREEAPFDDGQFSWISKKIVYHGRPDRDALLEQTQRFEPDVVLVASWHIGEFRYVLQRLGPHPLRVLCMDNQWHATWKQRLGVASSPVFVRRLYEAAFLPGERQASFARRLGFPDDRIWQGLYCPDAAAFAPAVGHTSPALPEVFGYLGRLSPEKGIQDLLDAYEIYRSSSARPWGLNVAGTGPLGSEVDRHQTVAQAGFVQPAQLGDWLRTIGCLVVPSRFEPWGVVLSEAATIGLPIIATDACGAVPHLVHDFANGRIAHTRDVGSLARCIGYVAGLSDEERIAMGRVSRGLARPYTPVRWADTVLGRSAELLADRHV
jgi:glycosyltransferase involved in cell wall biosynthesis